MERRDEVISGLFVLLGIAVIVAGALWLSRAEWRGEYRRLHARLPAVGQLKTGHDVTYRGVEIGRVEQIRFADGGVAVTMRVRRDAPLPARPVVVVGPRSLFGDWGVSVAPASQHPEVAADTVAPADSLIPGVTASDFAQLSEHTQAIASNLQDITDRLELAFNERTARNLSQAVDNFEQASGELVALMGRQRESFGGFAEDLASAGRTLRRSATDLDSTVSRLEAATAEGELRDIFDNTREATASLNRVSGNLRGTAGEIRRVVNRADSALLQAETVLAKINRGEGSLGRMANDPMLYEDLSATLAELQLLLDDLKTNPGKYFKFSIF